MASGQVPGYSTLIAYDHKQHNTIIIGTNLAAAPATGENAAAVLGKAVLAALYGSSAVPGGDPAGAPTTTSTAAAATTGSTRP